MHNFKVTKLFDQIFQVEKAQITVDERLRPKLLSLFLHLILKLFIFQFLRDYFRLRLLWNLKLYCLFLRFFHTSYFAWPITFQVLLNVFRHFLLYLFVHSDSSIAAKMQEDVEKVFKYIIVWVLIFVLGV